MKKLLTTTLLIATLAACQKSEEQNPDVGGSVEVVFTSAISTRATGTAWDEDDTIGVFMYYTADTGLCDNSENVLYTTSGGEGATFTSLDPLIYPEGYGVDFVAYHPYTTDYSNSNYTVTLNLNTADQSTEAKVKAQDFMVASDQGCSESSAPVLSFTRKMSRIVIAVDRKDTKVDAVLSDISLSGVVTDGTFTIANVESYIDASVSPASTTSNISLFENSSNQIEAIIIPQEEMTAKLKITIDGVELETMISGTFAANTQYNYNLSVGVDKVTFTAGSINSWTEETIGELTTEKVEDMIYDEASDVYEIYTASGLSEFAALVSAQGGDVNALLMCDIDLSEVCGEGLGSWTPIGSNATRYTGVFDGGGFEVQDLYIDSTSSQRALFAFVDVDGVVCNLGVTGSVTASGGSNYETAGVVAYNYGTVVNCYNEADISGEINVGGVVGHNDGCVVNCYNRGTITGTGSSKNIGGVCGQCDDESGVGYGYILACYNTGAVSGTENVGGVLGWLNVSDRARLSCCYCLSSSTNLIGWMNATTDNEGEALVAGALVAPAYMLDEAGMQDEVVVTALNSKAVECNSDENLTVKACAWKKVSDGYPELSFGESPSSSN